MKTTNKIRNADFSEGKTRSRGWVWNASSRSATWHRGGPDRAGDSRGVTLECSDTATDANWSQSVSCKPATFYHVDAVVTCDLHPAGPVATADRSYANEIDTPHAPSGAASGLILRVEPADQRPDKGKADARGGPSTPSVTDVDDMAWRETPGVHRAGEPLTVRAYYRTPEHVRRVRLSIGVRNASGTAHIQRVRLMEILEPEALAHPLAIPPPGHAVLPPRTARRIAIHSAQSTDRPLVRRLAAFFGDANVEALPRNDRPPISSHADALLLPDDSPPTWVRSLSVLKKLGEDRIVVVSLPAFAKLCNETVRVRRVTQEDDPIHAKVVHADHATNGFALHDVFPFAWTDARAERFVQNQLRRTDGLKRFLTRHGFVTILESVCNQDATSDRPVALQLRTQGGGLFVMDLEPAESDGSAMGEPILAMHLLLTILGHRQTGLGQYFAPARTEASLRQSIREMAVHFQPVQVHDDDVPVSQVRQQLVTVGGQDADFGLPLRPKPVILIRSGLTAGDAESVYGTWMWLKQLVRMEPHACPYGEALASQFRIAWIPLVAPWEAGDGWRRSERQPAEPMSIEFDGGRIAALIDIMSQPRNRIRVVLPRGDGPYERYRRLPKLFESFVAGPYFLPAPDHGASFASPDDYRWSRVRLEPAIVVDSSIFRDQVYQEVLDTGGEVVRVELPGCAADFAAHSIQRTGIAATLLEQIAGLQYGLIAVNRRPTSVQFDAVPPLAPGAALILDEQDPVLHARAIQAG